MLCLPFVIAGVFFIINNNSDKTMDWICICFFGMGIPLGLFNLLDKRPQIIINNVGIFDRMGYRDFLNWDWIKDAYLYNIKNHGRLGISFSKQTFVCLIINQNFVPLLKGNKVLRKFGKDLEVPQVAISLSPLQKIDSQKFVEFIKAMSTADAASKQNLLLTTQL